MVGTFELLLLWLFSSPSSSAARLCERLAPLGVSNLAWSKSRYRAPRSALESMSLSVPARAWYSSGFHEYQHSVLTAPSLLPRCVSSWSRLPCVGRVGLRGWAEEAQSFGHCEAGGLLAGLQSEHSSDKEGGTSREAGERRFRGRVFGGRFGCNPG